MEEINILDTIDVYEIKTKYHLTKEELVNYSIGNDNRIYILFSQKIPKRIDGMFVPTTSNTKYIAVAITVDWTNGGMLHSELLDFGVMIPNIHIIQPLKENYLLLGARATLYKDGTHDKNAVIVDTKGNIIHSMCLGDGIEACLVDNNNNIITSYFDEGIFGNNGWNQPIGLNGLIVWDALGNKIWENSKYDICDCYAINLDEDNCLWFYYYDDFMLVKTNYQKDIVLDPKIEGSHGFLLNQQQNKLLFNQGYNKHDNFIIIEYCYDRILKQVPVQIKNNGKDINFTSFKFRSSKAIFCDNDKIYYFDWL